MFFRKRSATPPPTMPEASLTDDELAGATRVDHKAYTIVVLPRMLHNGNWIARIYLEQSRPDGLRRYYFAGPMSEYPSEEDARSAGVEHTKARLETR